MNLKDFDDPVQSEFSKSCRKVIRRALRDGITFTVDKNPDTIDEFNDEEPKVFFGLDDYGYFAKYTESEDITRLQMQLNEIYKQKKKNKL